MSGILFAQFDRSRWCSAAAISVFSPGEDLVRNSWGAQKVKLMLKLAASPNSAFDFIMKSPKSPRPGSGDPHDVTGEVSRISTEKRGVAG